MYIRKKRLNTNKSIQYALAKLSGVGPFLARQICSQLGFPLSLSLSELSYEDRESLIQVIEEYHVVERELKAKVKASKKHLLAIKCYRGYRLRDGLPANGQRTHTNAKTSKKLKGKLFI
jgi:small subunit ribosomal protein S13